MATITSTATGNWSTGATWAGGIAPTAADDAVIAKNHTVTVNDTTCVALSVVLNAGTTGADVGAILKPSVVADSKLTIQKDITSAGSTTDAYNSHVNFDMSSTNAYTHELVLNNSNSTTAADYTGVISGAFNFKGFARTRWSTITGAVSVGGSTATSADATGWKAGDAIVFATTTAYGTLPYTITGGTLCTVTEVGHGRTTGDIVIITVVTGGTTFMANGAYTITVTGADTYTFACVGTNVTANTLTIVATDILELGGAYSDGSTSLVFTATPDTTKNPHSTATFKFAHASGCYIGNLSSNLVVRTGTAGSNATIALASSATMTTTSTVTNTEFRNILGSGFGQGCLYISTPSTAFTTLSNNSFYNYYGQAIYHFAAVRTTRQNNIFYSGVQVSSAYAIFTFESSSPADIGTDDDMVMFRGTQSASLSVPGQHLIRPKISGHIANVSSSSAPILTATPTLRIEDGYFWSNNKVVYNSRSNLRFTKNTTGCKFGTDVFSGATNGALLGTGSAVTTFEDSLLPTGQLCSTTLTNLSSAEVIIKNRGVSGVVDPNVQEIYREHSNTVPILQKDIVTFNRATSSVKIINTLAATKDAAGTPITQSFNILAKAGTALKIIGFYYRDSTYGASTLPKVTLSGLGITPVVATMSGAHSTWEKFTIDLPSALAPTVDGLLSLTLASQSTTAGSYALFSGVPLAPFITRCRHYGYLFDETTPTRTVNNTIQETTEATAAAYTGMTITWGTTASDFTSVSLDQTFQKLYDYSQAQACLNVSKVLPMTGAGVGGNPSLFASGDITVSTTKKINGSGTVEMGDSTITTGSTTLASTTSTFTRASGSFVTDGFVAGDVIIASGFATSTNNVQWVVTTVAALTLTISGILTADGSASGRTILRKTKLSTEFAGAVAYTYSGGTWAQATTVPTFGGGIVQMGASGTYTFVMSSSTVLSLTPTAPSTYVMGSGTFTGTVTLRNTTAHAITVELPNGTTYTTANNGGGAITVSTPAVYQSVTISGAVAGSRIQVYDTTSSTQLYNGTPAFPYTWTDGTPAAATRAIRLRVAYQSTVTAKDFIEASIGTCATSGAGKDVSYLVSQTADETYNANGIDGSSVYATSGITFTDAATDLVNCNIAGGTVSWATIYACFVYWSFTSTGIANNFTYISAPDTANYILSGMKIKNTSATPLTVTGGWGRDATTLTIAACIDTAGSTGNIFPEPDHVVAYASGSGLTAGEQAQLATAAGVATTIGTPAGASVSADIAKTLTTGKFLALK